MKRLAIAALAILLVTPGLRADDKKPALDPAEVKTKASYVFGHNFGSRMKSDGVEIDVDQFLAGLKDAFAGKPSKLKQGEVQAVMQQFQREMIARQRAKAEAESKANKEKGEAFLTANSKKEGVKVTESGLQYKVEKEGTGASPKATDTVKVHYHGTLLNGEVFDSSVQREEPATFGLNQVIKGWTEGLQLMKVGGKTTFYIPSDLAYGSSPRGPGGPNSTLVFEVELLDIIER